MIRSLSRKVLDYFSTRYVIYVSLYLISIFFSVYIAFRLGIGASVQDLATVWGALILVATMGFLLLYFSRHRTLLKPYVFFLMAAFLCWFGQVFVIMFNLETTVQPIMTTFDANLLNYTLLYSVICYFAMYSVGLIFGRTKYDDDNHTEKIANVPFRSTLNIVGVSLVLVGGTVYFSELIFNLSNSIQYGYIGMFENRPQYDAIGNILSNLKMFFVPGILMLIVANKQSKYKRTLVMILPLIAAILFLATGGRAEAIALGIALFWIYKTELKSINLRRLIIVLLIAFLAIKIFNTIAIFRLFEDRTVGAFFELLIFGGYSSASGFADILNEFGFNIFSLYHTMSMVPSLQDFSFGYTYIASLLAIVPSLFFGGYSFSDSAALHDWLQSQLSLDYGPGYTIVAESYYNFGWLGFIAVALLGYIFIKMTTNKQIDPSFKSLQNVFIATVLYASLFMARDISLLIFRKYFYMVLIPLAIVMLFYAIKRHKLGLNDEK